MIDKATSHAALDKAKTKALSASNRKSLGRRLAEKVSALFEKAPERTPNPVPHAVRGKGLFAKGRRTLYTLHRRTWGKWAHPRYLRTGRPKVGPGSKLWVAAARALVVKS